LLSWGFFLLMFGTGVVIGLGVFFLVIVITTLNVDSGEGEDKRYDLYRATDHF
jgi:hypothetical protein